MKVVCYPKCGTCKKALAYLENLGIGYDYRDIKLENPSYEELKEWKEKSGLEMKDKLPHMTDEEKLLLLATDGMLVKRPIAIGDNFVLVGFKEKEWDDVFKK